MTNELFNFERSTIRVFTDDKGNPWFLSKELSRILEIKNNRDINSRLEDDQKLVGTIDTKRGDRTAIFINESGLYSAIFMSRTEKAKRFRKWVTSEVLPQIRKTGSYNSSDPLEALNSPEGIQKLLLIAADKLKLEQKLKQVQPQIEYCERVKATDEIFALSDFGGTSNIGRKKIFNFCRQIGWMYFVNKRSVPYKRIITKKYLVHKESEYTDDDGKIHQTHQVFITGLGKLELVAIYNQMNPDNKVSNQLELM